MNELEKVILSYIDALQSLFMVGRAETTSETAVGMLVNSGVVGRVERVEDNGVNRMMIFRRGYIG